MRGIIIISLLVLNCLLSQAQNQIVFENKTKRSFEFSYNREAGQRAPVNQVISILASGNNKPVVSTEYVYTLLEELRLTRNGNQLVLKASFQDNRVRGDIYYKGFNFSDILDPQFIDYQIVLKRGEQVVQQFDFDKLSIAAQKNSVQANFIDTLNAKNYTLEGKIKQISIDFNQVNIIKQRAVLVDDYYNAGHTIQNHMVLLNNTNAEDFENTSLASQNIAIVEAFLANSQLNVFSTQLPLNQYDPLQLQLQTNNLYKLVQVKRSQLNQTIANLPNYYYNKGSNLLQSGKVVLAKQAFTTSLNYNADYLPSILELSILEFKNGEKELAEARLNEFYFKAQKSIYTDTQMMQRANNLLVDIKQDYVKKADNQRVSGQTEAAIQSLEKAISLCNAYSQLSCTNEEIALNGLRLTFYAQLLIQSENSIKANKVDDAEAKLSQAKSYSTQYHLTPNTTKEGTIEKMIAQQRYNEAIEAAKMASNQNKFQEALDQIESARQLQQDNNLAVHPEMKKLLDAITISYCSFKLDRAEELVAGNQLKLANQFVQEARAIIARYGMESNTLVTGKMKSVLAKTQAKECENLANEITKEIETAKMEIQGLNYLNANTRLENALKKANSNLDCYINTKELSDLLSEILPAVEYVKLKAGVAVLVKNKQYQEALTKYALVGKYFTQQNIAGFNLTYEEEAEFSKSLGYNDFVLFVAKKYLSENKLEQSFSLGEYLILKPFNTTDAQYYYIQLAQKLCDKDMPTLPKGNPKKHIEANYSHADKRFKLFTKAYLDRWKHLK